MVSENYFHDSVLTQLKQVVNSTHTNKKQQHGRQILCILKFPLKFLFNSILRY